VQRPRCVCGGCVPVRGWPRRVEQVDVAQQQRCARYSARKASDDQCVFNARAVRLPLQLEQAETDEEAEGDGQNGDDKQSNGGALIRAKKKTIR
jgi:hypothetical protein